MKADESLQYASNQITDYRLPRTDSKISGQKNKDLPECFWQKE